MAELKDYVILVVDDEEDLRDVIIYDLERLGFSTRTAVNGAAAYEVMAHERIDLILSDVRMPGGDGVELLEKVRRLNPKLPPLILVSGFADITPKEAREKGAAGMLEKPFDRKLLMETLKEALGLAS